MNIKRKCNIKDCNKTAYQSFFKYPNEKLWFCEEHTNERLDEGKE